MSQSPQKRIIFLTLVKLFLIVENSAAENVTLQNSTVHATDSDSHDPYKDLCKSHHGEYYRETFLSMVCCGNDTLKIPDVMVHDKYSNEVYAECSKKFKKDDKSDLPTAMWKAFLCKLEKSKVFKSIAKMTFEELLTFLTQLYPEPVKAELKKQTAKCQDIDEKVDHMKIEKYMVCYFNAENAVCNKPYGKVENHDADDKKTKEHGCPVVPGLKYQNSMEYCCKKRYTPYPVTDFPGWTYGENEQNILNCMDTFSQRLTELMPATAQVTTANPSTDDDMNFQMHTSWDVLCHSACDVLQKNYTQALLKLDAEPMIKYYTANFGKSMKDKLSEIIMRRKTKEKIFLAMEPDVEKSKPMDLTELTGKFTKASEQDKIQYFCKFADTISFEERRALHEYCFDEKYGNQWGNLHHPYFVPQE